MNKFLNQSNKDKMRVVGIDPGTKGFSLLGLDEDKIFLDEMLETVEVIEDMSKLITLIEHSLPVDAIIGPSGYGLPVSHIKDTKESDLDLMLPSKSNVPVNEAIKSFYYYARDQGLPLYFTPGVIHLPTVPRYRKLNRMDMGTADKLCCAALALEQFSCRHKVNYSDCSLIFLEVGYGFTAAIGIEKGKVVDAVGGTSGFPGFLSPGAIDSELAIRIDKQPQDVLFTGGAQSLISSSVDFLQDLKNYPDAWNTLIEGAVKDIAIVKATTYTDEIIISGRLTRIPDIKEELCNRLSSYGRVETLNKSGKKASEAAEGAVIIGIGLLGGRYKGLVESLELNKALGTMYDYIAIEVKQELQ